MWWSVFFFNDTATTEIYTLSLHDALPISVAGNAPHGGVDVVLDQADRPVAVDHVQRTDVVAAEAESVLEPLLEIGRHTSELQSRQYLVCRLLLEKKKNTSSNVLASSSTFI